MKAIKQNNKGFTLLEAIIAIALLGAIIAAFSASIGTLPLARKKSIQTRALALLEEELSALRARPFSELTNRTSARFLGVLYNRGKWLIKNTAGAPSAPGALVAALPASPVYRNFTGLLKIPAPAAGDFILKAKVKIPTDGAGTGWQVGFIFRARDLENNYRLLLEQDKLKLEREQGGTLTQLSSDNVTINLDSWYTVEVRAVSSAIKALLNDVPIRELTDATFDFGEFALLTAAASSTPNFDDLTLVTTATSTWNFDNYGADALPAEWKQFGAYDFKNGVDYLTIADYLGQTNLKKITAEIQWEEGAATGSARLETLIAQ